MKLTAVTMRQDLVRERNERVDALDMRWAYFLQRCGSTALPIPNCVDTARRLLERASPTSMLLTGGGDPDCISGETDVRDKVEALMIDWALRRELPVVGVCRGLQALLGSDGIRWTPVPDHVAVEHMVSGSIARRVNSFHRHGALTVTRGWQVLARSADGFIEAVEDAERRRAGVMWHPERLQPFDEQDLQLFSRWLANEPQPPRPDYPRVHESEAS